MMPIRNRNGYEVLVDDRDINQWVKLTEFKSFCRDNIIERVYNYFLAFLELASSLCYERNYLGIAAFDPIFKLELCFDCAKDENIPFEIRAKFTKLLLFLHLDKNHELENLRFPNLSRVWNDIKMDEVALPHSKNIPAML